MIVCDVLICNEDTLKFIQENCPNIQSVSLYIVDTRQLFIKIVFILRELSTNIKELSQAGVEHLKNMKRLHTLEFVVYNLAHNIDCIIKVAGEVPSLENCV
jgi:hypothetical protein